MDSDYKELIERLREELAAAKKDAAEYRRMRQAWLDATMIGSDSAPRQENRDEQ